MKILFIGDIVARAGRETAKKILPSLKKEYKPDLILANAENMTHGNGFSPDHVEEFKKLGVDLFTAGNHAWGNKAGMNKLNDPDFPVIRPLNYPDPNTPGRGYAIIKDSNGNKILCINLMGRSFMKLTLDCPFRAMDKILDELKNEDFAAVFVDFHAETTSEKYALGFYLDGRISALIGTHTHVATTDARILEKGTAYITDAGMVGAYDSVIGVKKDIIIHRFLTQMPVEHEPEENGKMVFSSVLIEIDEKTKKALDIKHIQKFL